MIKTKQMFKYYKPHQYKINSAFNDSAQETELAKTEVKNGENGKDSKSGRSWLPFGLWKRKKHVEPVKEINEFTKDKTTTIDLSVMNGNGNVTLASIKEEQEEEQQQR